MFHLKNAYRLLILSILSYSINSFALVGFETSEHETAGNAVKLKFNDSAHASPLHLPNGISLTYGQIVSLGDFYGVVGQPISEANTLIERKERFTAAFNTFAHANVKAELENVLTIAADEMATVEKGLKEGQKAEDIYTKISSEYNRRWNCATGGGCSSEWWASPGRYLKLTAEDFSHFGNAALLAYQAGHEVALEEAKLARETHDASRLETAYAMNAYASHFLSDRFAAGHIRTPRHELFKSVTPGVIGSLLASFMHNEDNHAGLHVHNQRGNHWIAMGDKNYFDKTNDANRELLGQALQASADEVFAVYQHNDSQDNVLDYIPQADEVGEHATQDISSLFFWDTKTNKLLRRKDISNVYNREWTANWWGWTTLILLAKDKSLPIESQVQLLNSPLREKALRDGLITDKNLSMK